MVSSTQGLKLVIIFMFVLRTQVFNLNYPNSETEDILNPLRGLKKNELLKLFQICIDYEAP